jgi:branched-subunit amino acid aminotransferase/4-amino-4-deoxychorismate lyase
MINQEQVFASKDFEVQPVEPQEIAEGRLAVADSWLVEDGRARHHGKHFQRFANWVNEIDAELELSNFFRQVTQLIPREGAWFPRIEFIVDDATGKSQLVFRLREAPDRESRITLWSYSEADPRVSPTIKGPDLSLGMQMRRAAQMHGAEEAVLLTPDGFIVEGALSSIVWFRDDVLCAPGDDLDWIPSITRQEVFSIADSMGLQTRAEKVKPADLVGLEIWALSSLHGIRLVDEWIGLGGPVGPGRHLDVFTKRLRMLSSSINE